VGLKAWFVVEQAKQIRKALMIFVSTLG